MTTVGDVTTTTVRYGMTSLPPEELLVLVRQHWQIETGLHYRRDVTLHAGASLVRSAGEPDQQRPGTVRAWRLEERRGGAAHDDLSA
ncbi:MAG: hypothetical protein NVS2B7_29080 [Herpetosiphon sp.]